MPPPQTPALAPTRSGGASRRAVVLTACFGAWLCAAGLGAQVTLDAFATAQGPVADPGSPSSTVALGAPALLVPERDLALRRIAGSGTVTAEVAADELAMTAPASARGELQIAWDGADGDAGNLDTTGLGGLDLTGGGQQGGFRLTIEEASAGSYLLLTVYQDATRVSRAARVLPAISSPRQVIIDFGELVAAPGAADLADLTQVGAITLQLGSGAAAAITTLRCSHFATVAPAVAALKVDRTPAGGAIAGGAQPGETIRYRVTLSNAGGGAEGVDFTDLLNDPNLALVAGSLRTTPLARRDHYATVTDAPVDSAVSGVATLLANDLDLDGDPLAVAATGSAPTLQGGTVAIAADGHFVYVPPAGFQGVDGFVYTLASTGGDPTADAVDQPLGPVQALATVTIVPPNAPPTATDKLLATHSSIRLSIGSSGAGNLLDGAIDADGDPIHVGAVTNVLPATSTVVFDAQTGAFSFDPRGGFVGTASFQFTVCDDSNACSTPATATVEVTGPPIFFVDQSVAVAGDGRMSQPFRVLFDVPSPQQRTNPANPPGIYAPGARIFVHHHADPYLAHGRWNTSTVQQVYLFAGEQLIGQGAVGSFDAILGVQVPAVGTLDPRPVMGGVATRPQLTQSSFANAVAIRENNVVRGIHLHSPASNRMGLETFGYRGSALIEDVTFTGVTAFRSQGINPGPVVPASLTFRNSSIAIGPIAGSFGTAVLLSNCIECTVSFEGTPISGEGLAPISIHSNQGTTLTFDAASPIDITQLQPTTTTNRWGMSLQSNYPRTSSPFTLSTFTFDNAITIETSGVATGGLMIQGNTQPPAALPGSSMTFNGPLTLINTNSRGLYVNGHSHALTFAGAKTFSVTTSTGTIARPAIELRDNAAPLAFVGGGLTVTGSNSSTGNGTIGLIALNNAGGLTVTGAGNTVDVVGAPAVQLGGALGAAGVTLQRVSVSNGRQAVILDRGGSTGLLHVTGTGAPGSGGTMTVSHPSSFGDAQSAAIFVSGGRARFDDIDLTVSNPNQLTVAALSVSDLPAYLAITDSSLTGGRGIDVSNAAQPMQMHLLDSDVDGMQGPAIHLRAIWAGELSGRLDGNTIAAPTTPGQAGVRVETLGFVATPSICLHLTGNDSQGNGGAPGYQLLRAAGTTLELQGHAVSAQATLTAAGNTSGGGVATVTTTGEPYASCTAPASP